MGNPFHVTAAGRTFDSLPISPLKRYYQQSIWRQQQAIQVYYDSYQYPDNIGIQTNLPIRQIIFVERSEFDPNKMSLVTFPQIDICESIFRAGRIILRLCLLGRVWYSEEGHDLSQIPNQNEYHPSFEVGKERCLLNGNYHQYYLFAPSRFDRLQLDQKNCTELSKDGDIKMTVENHYYKQDIVTTSKSNIGMHSSSPYAEIEMIFLQGLVILQQFMDDTSDLLVSSPTGGEEESLIFQQILLEDKNNEREAILAIQRELHGC